MNIYIHEQYIYSMSRIHSVRVMSVRRELKNEAGGFCCSVSEVNAEITGKKEVSGLGGY